MKNAVAVLAMFTFAACATSTPDRAVKAASSLQVMQDNSSKARAQIDTVLSSLVNSGGASVGAAGGIRADINRAYEAVRSPEGYNPVRFRAALGQAAGAIGSAPFFEGGVEGTVAEAQHFGIFPRPSQPLDAAFPRAFLGLEEVHAGKRLKD